MATRLLSFLTDIEKALAKESAANMGPSWEGQRMVNYRTGLARLTLTPAPGSDASVAGGTLLVQSFNLADGSVCLKLVLGWTGSDVTVPLAVYAKPQVDWNRESRQIAATWLAGPPSAGTVVEGQVGTDGADTSGLVAATA